MYEEVFHVSIRDKVLPPLLTYVNDQSIVFSHNDFGGVHLSSVQESKKYTLLWASFSTPKSISYSSKVQYELIEQLIHIILLLSSKSVEIHFLKACPFINNSPLATSIFKDTLG